MNERNDFFLKELQITVTVQCIYEEVKLKSIHVYYKIICRNYRTCPISIKYLKNIIHTHTHIFKSHLLTEISGLESSYRSFLASITASYNLRYCPSLATKHALGELQYAPTKYLRTFKI